MNSVKKRGAGKPNRGGGKHAQGRGGGNRGGASGGGGGGQQGHRGGARGGGGQQAHRGGAGAVVGGGMGGRMALPIFRRWERRAHAARWVCSHRKCVRPRQGPRQARGSLQDGDETRQAWDTRQARVRQKQRGSRGGGRHCDADRDRCLERGPVHAPCREERTPLSSHGSGPPPTESTNRIADSKGCLRHSRRAVRGFAACRRRRPSQVTTRGTRAPGGLVSIHKSSFGEQL